MNRYLQWLLGLAALVVVAVGLVILSFLAQDLWRSLAGPRHVQDVVNIDTADPTLSEDLSLRDATLVGDGPLTRVSLYAEQRYEQAGSFSSYDKTSGRNLVNIGFLTPGEPARWMFPRSGVLIYDHRVLSLSDDLIGRVQAGGDIFEQAAGAASLATPAVARDRDAAHEVALMLVLVEADSNGDNRLSGADTMTLALTRPDGSGRTDLASGLIAPPQVLPARRDLGFLIETAEGRVALRVDAGSFTITDRQPVTLP